jgi:hypothetical protein
MAITVVITPPNNTAAIMRIETPMLSDPDLVSRLLDWSNAIYVLTIVVTVFATSLEPPEWN